MIDKFTNSSFLRAQELAKHRMDTNIEYDDVDECWIVKSQSNRIEGFTNWKVYFSFRENKWMCECPSAWRSGKYCKHVLAVIIKLKKEKARTNA